MNCQLVLEHIQASTAKISSRQFHQLIKLIKQAPRIYVIGQGRSGLISKAFAMRLVHLGKICYVAGETVTPALRKGDLLLAVSGSGTTTAVFEAAKTAKKLKGKVVAITASKNSPLAKLAHHLVIIPAKITKSQERHYEVRELKYIPPLPPLGSLFEVSTLIFFESCVIELMKQLHISEKTMNRIHANL